VPGRAFVFCAGLVVSHRFGWPFRIYIAASTESIYSTVYDSYFFQRYRACASLSALIITLIRLCRLRM
jgi:hypothetical protein